MVTLNKIRTQRWVMGICAIVVIFILSSIYQRRVYYSPKQQLDDAMIQRLGENQWLHIYNYEYVRIANFYVLTKIDSYDTTPKTPNLQGKTAFDTVGNVYDYVRNLGHNQYSYDQANPNLISTKGGNCLAYSLYVSQILNKYGIRNELYRQSPTHVIVKYYIGNSTGEIDIPYGILT